MKAYLMGLEQHNQVPIALVNDVNQDVRLWKPSTIKHKAAFKYSKTCNHANLQNVAAHTFANHNYDFRNTAPAALAKITEMTILHT